LLSTLQTSSKSNTRDREREGYENAVLTHPVGVSTFLDTKAYTFLGEKVTMTQASLQNPIIPGHNCTFRRQIKQIIMA